MKIQNADRFLAKMSAMPRVAKDEVQKALKVSGEEIVDLARRAAPKRTGVLAQSIDSTIGKYVTDNANVRGVQASAGGHDLLVTIHAGDEIAWYAALVEFGTSPHTIRAKNAEALGRDGRFGPVVEHPGSSAQPFFYPSYRLGKKRAKSRIGRAISTAARKVAAGAR